MGRTARRALECGLIAFLLALTAVAGGAARAAADALMEPSPAPPRVPVELRRADGARSR